MNPISLNRKSMQPADDQARRALPDDGERSLASQIFQVAAANIYYDKHSLTYTGNDGLSHLAAAGSIKVAQSQASGSDSGLRLIDYTWNRKIVVSDQYDISKPID